jgi:hypothetical protein
MDIVLNESEQAMAKVLAHWRNGAARGRGIANERIGDQDDEITDLNGMGGELAFCRAANVYPDFTIIGEGELTPVADCHMFGGTWDIKTTPYANGKLLLRPSKVKKGRTCDYYALVTGKMPRYRIIGWASAAELIDKKNLTDLGHGPTYALEQDRLHRCAWIGNKPELIKPEKKEASGRPEPHVTTVTTQLF